MRRTNELKYTDLRKVCDPSNFNFDTTLDLEPINTQIGQERGIKALEFGLNVDINGYNIYLEGPTGVGKTSYTRTYLDTISKGKKTPNDWCYIYNFDNPNEPIAISLPTGQGKEFKESMECFVNDIKKDISNMFNNEDFEKEKALITNKYDMKREDLMTKLNEKSESYGFTVKSSQNGIYMMPILNGKAIEEEEFNKLDDEIKQDFENKSIIVQQQIIEAIEAIKQIEKESSEKINKWQANIALLTVNGHINLIKNKFKKNKKIMDYLGKVKEDVLKNISLFVSCDKTQDNKNQQPPTAPTMPTSLQAKAVKEPWLKYQVNLFVDNSLSEGAPVVQDSNYSYNNIFGSLEYENFMGQLHTDYTMLKPGLLHKANGGYIFFQAKDLLANSICYENLKKCLRNKQLALENAVDNRTSMVLISLKPEPIPLDLKVILIGNDAIYQSLLAMDPDFQNLFKIKVEFEDTAPMTQTNMNNLARFVAGYCETEELPPFDKEAIAKIVEFASKLADDQDKISTRFSKIAEVIVEASTWAKMSRKKIVTANFVDKALAERTDRVKKYDERYIEMIEQNTLLISTNGSKVGEINGLTIMNAGDYSFGKPVKITANTYIGKCGVTNIEREVNLSGSTHAKGVYILSSYLGEKFAQEFPLSLNASICFEQMYNGVDGDSASSTELYAILSSLSNIPINQAIAVTGSVNQKGEIQPIGGVNNKIEGFFQICKSRGLDGSHGVIIPKQNIRNLNLSYEVIEAVKNEEFHIYAISSIDEGIEILTGVPAGKIDDNGEYPNGSVNNLVYKKLESYFRKNLSK